MSTILTFGQAMDKAREGLAVSASKWLYVDRISTHRHAMDAPQASIWSPETRKVMEAARQGMAVVEPYSTKITQSGKQIHVNSYIPNNEDMNDKWMLSTTARRLIGLEIDEDGFNLSFDITDNGEFYMFRDLYESDCIGYRRSIIFIGGSVSANIRNATIYNMMEAHLDNRDTGGATYDGFTPDTDFLRDGWLEYCTTRIHDYQFVNIDAVDLDFTNQINLKDSIVIVDKYSLDQFDMSNGENAYNHVSNIMVQMPNPVYHLDIEKEIHGYNSI